MTSISTYAQERISFYGERFRSASNQELSHLYSSLAANGGWTAERSYYSYALTEEIRRRGCDFSKQGR
jgi:hypothetical protein